MPTPRRTPKPAAATSTAARATRRDAPPAPPAVNTDDPGAALMEAVRANRAAEVRALLAAGAPLGTTVRVAKKAGAAALVALLEAEKKARTAPRKLLESLVRPALVHAPAGADARDARYPARRTRFGGVPWRAAREPWPACPTCAAPLAFIAQVNLSAGMVAAVATHFGQYALKTPHEGLTLIQLFACARCRASRAFAPENLARLVDAASDRVPPVPPDVAPLPEVLLELGRGARREVPVDDLGDSDEHPLRLAISLARAAADLPSGIDPVSPHEKFGGWPAWVARRAYPTCPLDGARMDRLVLQLAPGGLAPDVWGDGGTGYVMQCPRDPAHLTLLRQMPGVG